MTAIYLLRHGEADYIPVRERHWPGSMADLALVPEPEPGHEAAPRPGTIYSVAGQNTGLRADPRLPRDYPMEAFCAGCDEIVRLESFMPIGAAGRWRHTGRKPGED